MDEREMQRRGPQLVAGAFAASVGGLLVLFALQYGTQQAALARDSGRNLALAMGVIGTLLGAAAIWLYRGSIAMMLVSIAVVGAGLWTLVRVAQAF